VPGNPAVTVGLKVKLGSIPDSAIGISLLAQFLHCRLDKPRAAPQAAHTLVRSADSWKKWPLPFFHIINFSSFITDPLSASITISCNGGISGDLLSGHS
jgi:hypothetical protein